jgi:hypothetical protein
MAGQPQGLFDVTGIQVAEPASPGFPPTLPPAKIIDRGDPFSVSANFVFVPANDTTGWIFPVIQWLQCNTPFNIAYTITYTAEAMDSNNFFSLGTVAGNLTCAGGALNLNYGAPATTLNVAAGIPNDGVYKVIATVTFNMPGIVGYAEDVIQVHAQAQLP